MFAAASEGIMIIFSAMNFLTFCFNPSTYSHCSRLPRTLYVNPSKIS